LKATSKDARVPRSKVTESTNPDVCVSDLQQLQDELSRSDVLGSPFESDDPLNRRSLSHLRCVSALKAAELQHRRGIGKCGVELLDPTVAGRVIFPAEGLPVDQELRHQGAERVEFSGEVSRHSATLYTPA